MSNPERVFFDIPNKGRFQRLYDRSRLKLGSVVFVRFSEKMEDAEFSPEQSDGSVAYWVRWIATSEWYVELTGRFELRPEFAEKIHREIGEFLSRAEIDAAIARFLGLVRMERFYQTAELGNNPLSVVFTILDRLQVCRRLRQSPPFPAMMVPYLDDPLVSYLYLTCFDRLGQPSDWLDFESWLKSPDTKKERNAAVLEASDTSDDQTEAVLTIHRQYLRLYGVKASFFRFLREVLPKEVRQQLLSSIEQTISTYPPVATTSRQATEDEKEKYLFKRRNDYTHKVNFQPPMGEWFGGGQGSPVQVFGAATWTSTQTQGWPDILEKAVRAGLARYLFTA